MEFLRVTIIDACNLPPMDADGKADPYIEVSLRPGQKKFSTTIKPNSLNPTFNENCSRNTPVLTQCKQGGQGGR